MRDSLARFQTGTNALEDRPEHRALRLRQPRLSAEACHIAICLPVLQLPGIYHLLPFGEQEVETELVAPDGVRRVLNQLVQCLAAGNRRRPDVCFVETQSDGVE